MPNLTGYAQAFDGVSTKVYDSATEALPFAVGTKALDASGNEYTFVKGVASVAIGSVCTFDETYTLSLIAANAVGNVGVAVSAIDAATKYGFVMTSGSANVSADTDVADNKPAYISGSGTVNDASVAGDAVFSMIFRGARTGAGLVLASFNNPFVTDGVYLV